MRAFPEDDYDFEELDRINAKDWQKELLKLNPEYPYWGPYEDYMNATRTGWNSIQEYDTWNDFGPWKLDELNELANFYFEVERESVKCESCDGSGMSKEAKQLSDDWYDFGNTGRKWSYNINQEEVQALINGGRLNDLTSNGNIPTANKVNTWAQKGLGHDSINQFICVERRCKRLGYDLECPLCNGHGYKYIEEFAHVSLILWMLHPRKGCSRGIIIKRIEQKDLKVVFEYLKEARTRNFDRFAKIV